jgi:hypothetical protein
VVIRGRSLRISSLVLVATALAMVLVLAGGRDQSRSPDGNGGAHDLYLQLTAPAVDEASLGWGRTILHIQGRRAAPVSGPAVPGGGSLIAPVVAALAVLLTAERVRSVVLPAQPAPRGPPAA